MADLKDIIFTILKWGIVVIVSIVLVLMTIHVIEHAKSLNTEQVIWIIVTYLVLMIGFFGAYREEFIYAVIFGIALILDLIYAYSSKASVGREDQKGVMVGLTIATWVFAFMIRFVGVHSIPLR